MLRVVTINTWHGHTPKNPWSVVRLEPAGHKEKRTASLLAQLRALDPDVVCMQECLPQHSFTAEVAAALGYDYQSKICNAGLRVFGMGVPAGIGNGEGISILAKRHLRMKLLGVRRLSGIGFANRLAAVQLGQLRFAMAVEVEVRGHKVVVINTHLRYAYPTTGTFYLAWHDLRQLGLLSGDPSETLVRLILDNMRVRDDELWRLLDWVRLYARAGVPVVIGADFNLDHHHDQMMKFTHGLGGLNVLPTADPENPWSWDPAHNRNIAYSTLTHHTDGTRKGVTHQLAAHYDNVRQNPDHLVLGPTFNRASLVDGGLALHRPHEGTYPSDHYGIWADVKLG